jgi:hypothetical protein
MTTLRLNDGENRSPMQQPGMKIGKPGTAPAILHAPATATVLSTAVAPAAKSTQPSHSSVPKASRTTSYSKWDDLDSSGDEATPTRPAAPAAPSAKNKEANREKREKAHGKKAGAAQKDDADAPAATEPASPPRVQLPPPPAGISLAVYLAEALGLPRKTIIGAVFAAGVPVLGPTQEDVQTVLNALIESGVWSGTVRSGD